MIKKIKEKYKDGAVTLGLFHIVPCRKLTDDEKKKLQVGDHDYARISFINKKKTFQPLEFMIYKLLRFLKFQ